VQVSALERVQEQEQVVPTPIPTRLRCRHCHRRPRASPPSRSTPWQTTIGCGSSISRRSFGVLLMATPMAKSAAKAHANRLEPIIVCGDPPM